MRIATHCISSGDQIHLKEALQNGWWVCNINGREARILLSEVLFSIPQEKTEEVTHSERRKRSGGVSLDHISSPRSIISDTPSTSSLTTDDMVDNTKKKESMVLKATKFMKGGFDKVKGTKCDTKKKKDEDTKKGLNIIEKDGSIQMALNHIKEAYSDVENLKTETQLIIRAFNQSSDHHFSDQRFLCEETPQHKMYSRMLHDSFTPLFGTGNLGKQDITLAPSSRIIYTEMLIPNINLNSVSKCELETLETLDFDIFPFKDRRDDYHTYMLIMSMFYRFDLPYIFRIRDETLYRFLYVISKHYRDVPFHNFFHAFNVTQTLYFFLTTCQAHTLFEPFEILCLLIAAICHDCDHPGLTNDFQRKAQTKVYNMHKKSVLENHHYLLCMSILAMPETNILANLPQDQEDLAYNYLRDLILSTDLAMHGVTQKVLKERSKVLQKHFKNCTKSSMVEEDKKLMMCAILMCSDLSNEIRKQEISRKWARLVFDEFISQASKEKDLQLPVTPFMDKDKIIVAKEQMNFIEKLCLPLYVLVAQIIPEVGHCCERLEENRNIWQRRLLLFCEDKKTDIKKLGPNKSLWENKQVKDKGNLSSTLATRASNSQILHKRSNNKFSPTPQHGVIKE